ncbi:MAG: hypothetical protein FRX49_08634 [Trebouxia sp. A1-2]|nr:MAG: hypothetical protein FRX49_08634 [Trebouxia sp. A1-2]
MPQARWVLMNNRSYGCAHLWKHGHFAAKQLQLVLLPTLRAGRLLPAKAFIVAKQVVLNEVSLDGIAQGPSRGGGLLNPGEEVAEQSHEEGQVQLSAELQLGATLAVEKPSENIMISAMRVKSGTIMDTGRNRAFRLSGSSERPAYPGFMVTKMPHAEFRRMSCPRKLKRVLRSLIACKTEHTCLRDCYQRPTGDTIGTGLNCSEMWWDSTDASLHAQVEFQECHAMSVCAAYLDGLSFAGTSRAQGITPTQSEHGSSQCHVAPVCQWGDDQTPIVALRCLLVAANMASSTVLSHSSGRPSVTIGATKGRELSVRYLYGHLYGQLLAGIAGQVSDELSVLIQVQLDHRVEGERSNLDPTTSMRLAQCRGRMAGLRRSMISGMVFLKESTMSCGNAKRNVKQQQVIDLKAQQMHKHVVAESVMCHLDPGPGGPVLDFSAQSLQRLGDPTSCFLHFFHLQDKRFVGLWWRSEGVAVGLETVLAGDIQVLTVQLTSLLKGASCVKMSLETTTSVAKGFKAGLNGWPVQRELPVQLHSLCKLVQVYGWTAQSSCVALEVLMQSLQLPQGDGVQQACEVCPPGFTVTHECLHA